MKLVEGTLTIFLEENSKMISINTKPHNGVIVELDDNNSYIFTDIKALANFMNVIFQKAAVDKEEAKVEVVDTYTEDTYYTDGK